MEQTNSEERNEPRKAGGLPPEVEAELRHRSAQHAAPAPWLVTTQDPAARRQPEADPTTTSHSGDAPPSEKTGVQGWLARLGPIGILLVFLFGKAKYLAVVGKFALPILKTGSTMLLSMWFYAVRGGWPFAAGFVLSILVHEMGHVFVAWRLGIPVSAPIFIPGFGALILQKQAAKSAWDEALIGIGGPIGGTLAALFCLAVYHLTGSDLMLGLAFVGFMLNLFNLAPIFPLDGGWITGAVSPRIWLLGVIGMVVLFATGVLHNPLLLLLVLISLPRLWRGLTTGDVTPEGGIPTTPRQRLIMGLSYVGLCALLVWLAQQTHRPV